MLKWVAVRNQGMTRVTYFAILHQKSLAGRPELKVGERPEGEPGRAGSAAGEARPFRQWVARRPALLSAGPPPASRPVTVERLARCQATQSDLASRGVREGGAGVPRMLSQFRSRHPGGCRGLCSRVAPLGFRVPRDSDP